MRKQFFILFAMLLASIAGIAQTVNSTDGNFNATNADGNLILRTTTSSTLTQRLTILGAPGATAGFVGIGTATPTDLLHINGNARANQLNLVNGVLNTASGTTNMSFSINGTTRMTLLSGGNFGVGTASPSDLLHVNGTARANQLNLVGGTLNTTSGTTNMNFNINGTNRMQLQATTGALGIGVTPVAGELLHVNGSARAAQFNSSNGIFNTVASDLSLNVNGTNRLRILNANGFVGISKASPLYELDVNGTINASNILINGAAIGGAFSGVASQIPFVNATNNGYIGSTGLVFLAANNQFITGNNNAAPAGSNTFTSGDQNVNKGLYGSAMFGELSEIDVNVGAAIAGGEGVYIGAYGGHSMGRGTAIRGGAFYSYIGGWWEPNSTIGKTNLKVPQVSGTSSFGYYSTDPGQIDNHGVRANSSAILGGKNSDIPPGSHYSVVLGGLGIKARDNDPQQVYVPNLNIVTAPAVNNALTQVVVRDGTTGQLKSRDASTLSQWVTSSSGINYPVGAVGIGTPLTNNPNGYTLAVNGKIGAKDVQVETASTTWPDYVFAKDYRLPSLTEVEKYIQENNHLENVPSAKEIEKNGHSLGEMDKILLKKVEELTLYVIQQQKEIEELKKKIEKKN
jgi:hypothetical protein